ncbi:MAG: SURF1 family protein [Acidimicrobiia bacterium]|nr:MAG: SURF1 family protein [Acidimicrobiia bacterium]
MRFDTNTLRQPRWIVAVLVGLVLVVAFVRLGLWQLDRLEERRGLNATIEARMAEPARPLVGILGQYGDDGEALLYRRAEVEGTYRTDAEFFSIGRSIGDVRGTLVATPLDRSDGTVLIVVRGLVPPGTTGPPAAGFEPPEGLVKLIGRIDDGEEPTPIGESDPEGGDLTSLSRLDLEYIDRWVEGEVLPITLILEDQEPPDSEGEPRRVLREELSEGSHLGYAIQWFSFALIVGIGVAALVYRAGTGDLVNENETDRTSQL